MNKLVWAFLVFVIYLVASEDVLLSEGGCIPRDFGYGSFVCVCNSSHCDSLEPINSPDYGQLIQVVTNKASKRWQVSKHKFKKRPRGPKHQGPDYIVVKINRQQEFQSILGFGGAFTDAAGINIKSVGDQLQDFILRGYFGNNGLEYNLGRVPIGGSDFSTHPYSYDDLTSGQTDPLLKNFALQKEDFEYKIPLIKEATRLSAFRGVEMKFYCSPWSGPGWMKNNGKINGKGGLLKQYYPTWASYIVKFLEEYEKYNVSFYGLTTQNEPTAGLFANYPFNAMGWLPEDQADWIGHHLGPQLNSSGFGNITVFMLDDQRTLLPVWIKKIMAHPEASKYVGGVAVHWYQDFAAPAGLLNLTHEYFPDLPILYTEACAGWAPWDILKVVPGSWNRAENYAHDIIEDLNHWVVGWTDWNLALNPQGGPNWVKNFVDSPIIVNQSEDEFWRQPTFYALGHFSKILPEGSVRVDLKISGPNKDDIYITSFKRPDQSMALVALNKNRYSVTLTISDSGKNFNTVIDPHSIVSFVWKI